MLGDAHLELAKNGKSARLKIEQSKEKKLYVEHLRSIFHNWTPGEIHLVVHQLGENWAFSTTYSRSLLEYQQRFYKDKKRSIPQEIDNGFTALSFAYLYMDDGGVKSKESKGVFINTYSLIQDEQEFFCHFLFKKFHLKAKVVQDSKIYKGERRFYPRIYISGDSYDVLVALLKPYVLPMFSYKIPPPRSKKSFF